MDYNTTDSFVNDLLFAATASPPSAYNWSPFLLLKRKNITTNIQSTDVDQSGLLYLQFYPIPSTILQKFNFNYVNHPTPM
ncbi:MAG: hypothetical protein M0R68_00205 [Bacteroidetes bacterium]|nr:hypothetical protein [Bacteroidota bacterium]